MRKRISQREAARLRKRVKELEQINAHQTAEWPNGVIITSIGVEPNHPTHVALRTARKLRFAASAVAREGVIWFYAMPVT